MAHTFERRTESTLKQLLKRLGPYHFDFYCTDDWKPYARQLPEVCHVMWLDKSLPSELSGRTYILERV